MAPLIVASALIASYVCYVEGHSSCTTPSKADGSCVPLHECSDLMTVVRKPNKSEQDMQLLKMSQCENDAHMMKVCCPAQINKPSPRDCTMTAVPPDPKNQCCGRDSGASDKIIAFGGIGTAVDQYPWLALIEYIKDHRISLSCGGTLISGQYVLTAGHCVLGKTLESGTPTNVRLGEYDTSNEGKDCVEVAFGSQDCTEGVTVIAIENVIAHPQYDPNARQKRNDIALLRLKQLAPYTDFIRPICLPTSDITLSPLENLRAYVAGWGAFNITALKSDIKLQVGLPLVPIAQCQPVYSVPKRNITLWQGQLCAGGEEGKDSCKGDSGGPLMYENDQNFEQLRPQPLRHEEHTRRLH